MLAAGHTPRFATLEEDLRSTISHEFGHFGHSYLEETALQEAGVPWRRRFGERGTAVRESVYDWNKQEPWQRWGERVGSTYAEENPHEAFAELFMARRHGLIPSSPLIENYEAALTTGELTRPMAEAAVAAQTPRHYAHARNSPVLERRHSSARHGLPIKSSAPGRFRMGGSHWTQ
jgi:hypothetical protein